MKDLRRHYAVKLAEQGASMHDIQQDLGHVSVATGKTRREVEKEMGKAIQFHLQGLREDGYEVPEPHSYSTYVEIAG